MKRVTIAANCLAVLLIAACKKENDSFKPEGLWRGPAYLYHAAILNRQNGTSRLYFSIPGTDTSKAASKVEGSFTMNRGKFVALFPETSDTLIVESTSTSATTLSGNILSTASGEAVPFNFVKQ